MASPSTSAPAVDHRRRPGKSYFQQTVCLADWWLVKAENDVQGRRLAVAGFTDRGKQAIRVFTSAPILKRYDAFTIESTDGVCIILKGFINKAHTLEHGFPSDVLIHFVFGFPLHWKDYDEKFVGKEPPSKDIVADKPLDHLARKLGSNCSAMGGTQPHLDSHNKDMSQGKTKANCRPKSKRAKSVAVPLPQKYSISGLQKESYCGGTSDEDHTAPELPENCLKDEVKSLSGLSCYGNIKVPTAIDKSTDYSQLSDSGGTLFACHLSDKKTQRAAKTKFDWDMSSLEKISSDNEVRAMAHSEVSGLYKTADKIEFCLSGAASKNDIPETCDQDKGIIEIKTRSKTRKAKNKAMDLPSTPASASNHTPAAVANQRGTVITWQNSLSKKAKALDNVAKQTSESETPEREKGKGGMSSPQSGSFNRSRSGRLLMPTMEFWRNQRAIYVDRTVTGIQEESFNQPLTE